jgi:hypothetical protein
MSKIATSSVVAAIVMLVSSPSSASSSNTCTPSSNLTGAHRTSLRDQQFLRGYQGRPMRHFLSPDKAQPDRPEVDVVEHAVASPAHIAQS